MRSGIGQHHGVFDIARLERFPALKSLPERGIEPRDKVIPRLVVEGTVVCRCVERVDSVSKRMLAVFTGPHEPAGSEIVPAGFRVADFLHTFFNRQAPAMALQLLAYGIGQLDPDISLGLGE